MTMATDRTKCCCRLRRYGEWGFEAKVRLCLNERVSLDAVLVAALVVIIV